MPAPKTMQPQRRRGVLRMAIMNCGALQQDSHTARGALVKFQAKVDVALAKLGAAGVQFIAMQERISRPALGQMLTP